MLWVFVPAILVPYAANQSGWMAAELGRQPWIVWGLLKTGDALSPAVSAGQVLGSLLMFGVIYGMLFLVWIHVLNDKIQRGPEALEPAAGMGAGFLAAAETLADPGGASLSEAHDDEEKRN